MIELNSFLEKFKKFINTDEEVKKVVISVVEEKTGIKLEKINIKIKENILYLKEHPAVKNEIFMNKETILKEIQKLSGQKIINIK